MSAPRVNVGLVSDAEQMRLLKESPAWAVMLRYAASLRDDALEALLNPLASDQAAHHWRGVIAGQARVLGLPEEIIAYEKTQHKR